MFNKKTTLEEQLYKLGLVFLAVGCLLLFVYFKIIHPKGASFYCITWSVLGIYCPGCGGTRAVEALLQGHFLQSLWYHPLVLYSVVLFGGFMLTQTLERLHFSRIKGLKFHNWYLFGALGLVIVNWVIKNILLLGFDISL